MNTRIYFIFGIHIFCLKLYELPRDLFKNRVLKLQLYSSGLTVYA